MSISESRARFGRRVGIVVAVTLLAAACTLPAPAPSGGPAPAALSPGTVAPPLPLERPQESLLPSRTEAPAVFPGTGVFVNPAPVAPVAQVEGGDAGSVTFNFINADVRDVLREILGEQLHLTYTIDSRVQGTITAQTGGPLPRAAVIPTLESILQANGLGLVESSGVYRVLPVAEAVKSGLGAAAGVRAGYSIRILPLRYVSASELKSILDPFLPPGGTIQADTARNLLIVTGPMADLEGISGLVRQFDVDWLRGTSFALYPLEVGTAKGVASDLNQIFGEGGSGPLAGLVRIVPLERLNAILVVSPQRSYLPQVKGWIDRFDYGADEMTPRLFEYRVQNSRAADLAAVLTKLLSSGQVATVQPTTSPGSRTASLIAQSSGLGASAMAGQAPGSGSGLAGAGSALAPALSATPGQSPTGQSAATTAPPQPGGQSAQAAALAPSGIGGGTGGNLELPPVRIVADEKNNALVIYARPHDYRMLHDVITRLDIVPLQVMIEATIAEVTLNDSLNYGLQYFIAHHGSDFSLISPSSSVTSPTNGIGAVADATAIYPGFNYVLSTANARGILSALSSITHVTVVSSPQLLVLDHETAALQVGDQVPILTQQVQSTLTSEAPIVNSVSYLNTGVVLQVTPRVNTSGLITLDINQQVSNVTSSTTTTTSETSSPTITMRQIVSSVVVQDGQTIALGGLIQDSRTKNRSGIPLLSDIPIVGGLLFGGTSNADVRTELIVLLSPRIVRNTQDAHAMTEELRNRMQSIRPLDLKAY